MQQALSGLRVLDVTQVMAGPFCAMLLCDMGADVIKLEPPAGDATRHWGGGQGTDTPAFNAVNRGKRSIVVDLKTSDGVDIARTLAAEADVLVENYRPGVMAGLGLDYLSLRTVNPRLVYASISGYGQTGPSGHKGGFDLVAQGVSGIMSVTGEPERAPVKAGVPLTDLGAGLFAVVGILAAIQAREKTGEGQHVDTALVDSGVALSVWEAVEFFTTDQSPQPLGSAHRASAPYQAIRCADGYITVGAANDRLFQRLCAVLGHPEWVDDGEFVTNASRVRNRERLVQLIEGITREQPCWHWLTEFEAEGIPSGPINSYAEVFSDPQVLAREMVVDTDHPALGRIRTLGTPIKLSGTPLTPGRPAPALGAHTAEVLAEVGLSEQEIARLGASGAVGLPS